MCICSLIRLVLLSPLETLNAYTYIKGTGSCQLAYSTVKNLHGLQNVHVPPAIETSPLASSSQPAMESYDVYMQQYGKNLFSIIFTYVWYYYLWVIPLLVVEVHASHLQILMQLLIFVYLRMNVT